MKKTKLHQPLGYEKKDALAYRVVRRGWKHPLDSSYSQRTTDRRWNTPDFPALYCCSSPKVARAVTLDLFRFAGLQMDDLRPELRPQLVEIGWQGKLADVATAEGIQQIGFPVNYPEGATRRDTQSAATVWHDNGWEGVVCRSASMHRLRYSDWSGSPDRWSELAIFTQRVKQPPKLLRRIFGHGWMNV